MDTNIFVEEQKKARIKFIKHHLKNNKKKKQNIFDKIDYIIPKRIEGYVLRIKEFRFSTKEEIDQFVSEIFLQFDKRFFDHINREISKSIASKSQFKIDIYDTKYLMDSCDRIICFFDKRFLQVVPHKIRNEYNIIESRVSQSEIKKSKLQKISSKKTSDEQAKIYIKQYLIAYPNEPKLTELSKNCLSNATWSRRISNIGFLLKCYARIKDMIEKPKVRYKAELEKLNFILDEISTKAANIEYQKAKKRKRFVEKNFKENIDIENTCTYTKMEKAHERMIKD
jgi:hypothetical protein